jgi:hypothetical protein
MLWTLDHITEDSMVKEFSLCAQQTRGVTPYRVVNVYKDSKEILLLSSLYATDLSEMLVEICHTTQSHSLGTVMVHNLFWYGVDRIVSNHGIFCSVTSYASTLSTQMTDSFTTLVNACRIPHCTIQKTAIFTNLLSWICRWVSGCLT